MIPSKPVMLVAGAVVLLAAGLYLKKKVKVPSAGGVAAAAVGVLGDAAAGVVVGIGDVLGVPRTDEERCQAALASGSSLDASKYCPASTFISSLFHSSTPSPSPTDLLPKLPYTNLGTTADGTQYDQMGNVIN